MAASVKMVAMVVPIIFLAATTLTFDLVNRHVPGPYMDEIFHIPQAMRYCRGEFDSYDPKLTTPPGLYLASVGAARLLSWIGHLLHHGTVRSLARSGLSTKNSQLSSNASQAQTTKWSTWRVVGCHRTTLEDGALCVEVHTIALLPPLYFFSFLYYTDVLSTLTVVAMFSAARRDRLCSAALLGGASLIVRQTNVVWLLFALGTTALRRLSTLGLGKRPSLRTHLPRQRASFHRQLNPEAASASDREDIGGVVVAPFTPVLGLAAVFVVRNGGIVLGDKEHHVAALHWAQACYLIAFAALFAWPTLLSAYARTNSPQRW
ncbi:hypothetical protein L7F22_004703 [Adiantum nelumboides]|nr:hypothetical protein [Adiantum nelumboides]